jgi:hypothetical protein
MASGPAKILLNAIVNGSKSYDVSKVEVRWSRTGLWIVDHRHGTTRWHHQMSPPIAFSLLDSDMFSGLGSELSAILTKSINRGGRSPKLSLTVRRQREEGMMIVRRRSPAERGRSRCRDPAPPSPISLEPGRIFISDGDILYAFGMPWSP